MYLRSRIMKWDTILRNLTWSSPCILLWVCWPKPVRKFKIQNKTFAVSSLGLKHQAHPSHPTSLSLGPALVFIKGIPLKAFLVAASTILPLKECLRRFWIFFLAWTYMCSLAWLKSMVPHHIFFSNTYERLAPIWMYKYYQIAWSIYYVQVSFFARPCTNQDTSMRRFRIIKDIELKKPRRRNHVNSFSQSCQPSAEWIILYLEMV